MHGLEVDTNREAAEQTFYLNLEGKCEDLVPGQEWDMIRSFLILLSKRRYIKERRFAVLANEKY